MAKEITAGVGDMNISDSDFPYIHEVRVVDAQNVVRIYSITFIKAPSEDPRLGNITTDRGTLSPIFESDKTTYSIEVPYEMIDINLITTKISQDLDVIGDGLKSLVVGINTFEIQVTAGSKSMTYTIHVNRLGGLAQLDWLTVSECEMKPEFDSKHLLYRVKVPFETESLVIDAGSKNPSANIVGIGEKELEVGINIFQVVVKTSEEVLKIYYVVVDREYENEEDNPYKDDLSLIYLSLTDEKLNEEFDPSVYNYTAKTENQYPDGVGLIAIAINPEADVDIDGNHNIVGTNHVITITVSLGDLSQDTIITFTLEDLRLMSDVHEIGELYISTIKPSQSVLDIKNQMTNPNEHLRIYKNGELMSDEEIVGTGAIIKLVVSEKEYDSKTIVVLGDISGDGQIRVNDFMSVQNHLLGTPLVDHKFVAADINGDGSIRLNDFMAIQDDILKIAGIHK
ncbi:MAG: hypothetical protein GX760_00005 [Erysipelothrix sp.]|nr:hypothetical protein [Erysipelothrix sp.]